MAAINTAMMLLCVMRPATVNAAVTARTTGCLTTEVITPWRLAQALDDGGVGHAATFTHRLQAVAAAGALEFVEQGCHELGA